MKFSCLLFYSFVFIPVTYTSISAQNGDDNSEVTTFKLNIENPECSINFPAEYLLENSKTGNGLKSELYRAAFGEDIFMFQFSQHKNLAVSSDNEMYMQATLESFIHGVHSILIKKEKFQYGKTTGLVAFLTIEEKNINVFYRLLIINQVQYEMIVISKSTEQTDLIRNFFNSFFSKN